MPSSSSGDERFRRLRDLLSRALEADEAGRHRLLAETAAGDAALAAELAALLRADQASSVLDRGLAGLVASLAGPGPAGREDGAVDGAAAQAALAGAGGRRTLRGAGWSLALLVAVSIVAVLVASAPWRGERDGWEARVAEETRLRELAERAGANGEWPAARAHGGQRLALAIALAAERPADPQRQAALAEARRELATAVGRDGGHQVAVAHLRQAVAIERRLAVAPPQPAGPRLRLAESLLLLGAALTAAGRPVEAKVELADADALLAVVSGEPADEQLRLRLQVAAETAVAEVALGRPAAALASQLRAATAVRALADRPSPSPRAAFEAMVVYRDLGDLHRRLASGARAEERRAHLLAARAAYAEAGKAVAGTLGSAAERGSTAERAEDRSVFASLAARAAGVEAELGEAP